MAAKKISAQPKAKKAPAKKSSKPSEHDEMKKKMKELEKEYIELKKKVSSELGKIKIKYIPGKAVKKAKADIAKNLEKMAKMLDSSAKKMMK